MLPGSMGKILCRGEFFRSGAVIEVVPMCTFLGFVSASNRAAGEKRCSDSSLGRV
jgi:hypothetical protein